MGSNSSLKTSGSNPLVFKKEELSHHFFLSVFGLQFSEFSVGVVVKRKRAALIEGGSPVSDATKIELQLGLTQEYTIHSS